MSLLNGHSCLRFLLLVAVVVLTSACNSKPKPLPVGQDIQLEDTTTVFNYGPAISVLQGTLYEATFVKETGEIVDDTDTGTTQVEKEFVLLLKRPISVNADTTEGFNDAQTNITQVQLVPVPTNARAYLNRRVKVTGKLWGAQTGHHYTPVLIQTTAIELNE